MGLHPLFTDGGGGGPPARRRATVFWHRFSTFDTHVMQGGTVSIRRISIFTVRRVVSGALVLAVHRALGLRLRVARRALGRRRVLADDLELAIAAARGRRALARCATH